MTEFANKLTPTEIASVLQESRPDLLVEFDQNHGGGIKALVATFKDGPATAEDTVYAGIAGGHLGWSDPDGNGGGWAELVASDEDLDAWDNDERISQADRIVDRLADVLWRQLPPRHPKAIKLSGAWRIEDHEETPTEEEARGILAMVEDLDPPLQVTVLEAALDEANQRLAEWERANAPRFTLEITENQAKLLWLATETIREANPGNPDADAIDKALTEIVQGMKWETD